MATIQPLETGYPLNYLERPGFFRVLDPANAPQAGNYIILVAPFSGKQTVQKAWNITTQNEYMRYNANSQWTNWIVLGGDPNPFDPSYLETAIADLEASVEQILLDLGLLQDADDDHDARLIALENAVAEHAGDIQALETTQGQHTTQIGALETASAAFTAAIDALEDTDVDFEARIAALEAGGGSGFDPTYLEDELADHEARIQDLEDTPPGEFDAGYLEDAIAALQTTVGTHTTNISNLQAADTALDARLDTLEGFNLDPRVDSLEADAIDFEARISALEALDIGDELADHEDRIVALEAGDWQPHTANLDDWSELDPTTYGNQFQPGSANLVAWSAVNPSAYLNTAGNDLRYQPLSANLTDWAGEDPDDYLDAAEIAAAYQAASENLDGWSALDPDDYLDADEIAAAYQPLSANLTAWSAVNPTAYYTAAQSDLAYQAHSDNLDDWANLVPDNYLDASEIAAAYQPLDADLTALAGLTTQSYGRGLLQMTDAAATHAYLGLEIGEDVQAYSPILSATQQSFLSQHKTKLDYLTVTANTNLDEIRGKAANITVTQAVDLDAMEARLAELTNVMMLKGNWDASAGTFPSGSAKAGWRYAVTVAGTVDGVEFNEGDAITALVDNPSTTVYSGNWMITDNSDETGGGPGTIVADDITDATTAGKAILKGSSYAAIRALLDLEIGTDVQGWSAVLDGTQESFLTSHKTKLDYITITGARDLDNLTIPASNISDASSNGRSLITAANYAAMKALLDLEIGTDVQAYSSVLQNTTASFQTADETKLDYITVTGAINLDTFTLPLSRISDASADGRSLVAAADYAAMRTLLGIDTSNFYSVGGTDVAIADGGTGASSAATGFANLKQDATTSATGVLSIATAAEWRACTAGAKALTSGMLDDAAAFATMTFVATTQTWDWSTGINQELTLTGTTALAAPSNPIPGTWRTIIVKGNDATQRTITFGASTYRGGVPTIGDCTSTKFYLLNIFCYTSTHFVITSKVASLTGST